MSGESEDADQVVYRKAEVRPASWANGARPTTTRDAAWVVPQPLRIVHQPPRRRRRSLSFTRAVELSCG